jgi:hypothetical protein
MRPVLLRAWQVLALLAQVLAQVLALRWVWWQRQQGQQGQRDLERLCLMI